MADPRSQRLLELLNLLIGAETPVTRARIRQVVPGYPDDDASFRRAIERDKATIREMGLTIETVASPLGGDNPPGYRIPPDRAFLRDPGLEPEELEALNLAVEAVRLEGLEVGPGLATLGGSPTAGGGAGATGGPLAEVAADDRVAEVFTAVTARRVLHFDYSGSARTVEPHRLAFTRGRWYLVGRDRDRGEPRIFRLDRIGGEVTAGEPGGFPAPAPESIRSVQLRAWLFDEGPAQTARLAVDADRVDEVDLVLGPGCPRSTSADGRTVFEVEVTNTEAFRNVVLGLGEHVELLGPAPLRDDLVTWLEALVGEGG